MTGADHQHNEAVVLAAQCIVEEKNPPQPIIPYIRERFGLTALEACEACALANKYRIARRAFG